ncbi:MAG TPA: IPT/TIG domain-containing protein [Bryobacteraceae bacterium]|nr:IPT/TIG domain-containing protein [Bryobacteraceae bacterium]
MKLGLRLLLVLSVSAFAALAQPVIGAVANGFSFGSQLSPGVLAAVFGSNLSGGSVSVTLNGAACPVTFVAASQLNIQIPWEAATGKGRVVVTVDGVKSSPVTVTISKYSPALVSLDGSGSGTGEFFSGPNLITTTNPANGGDTLTTYAIGLGATTPAIATGELTPDPPPFYTTLATPTINVGQKAATVFFSGLAPGVLAIDQLNLTLAPNTPVGTETVLLKIGSASTNVINIPIGCLDKTASVSVALGPLNHPSAGKYTQKVTITNTSGTTLPAKGSLVLTALTSSATLTNGGGASCPSSDGSPYKSFTFTGSGSAQTASVSLQFTDTTTGAITYGQRVLSK